MGCDGGTIPTRDELVKTRKKPERKDRDSELAFKWKHCAISQEALVKPLVACELGRLYNKETVLELLIDRSKFEVAYKFDHIKGLKDIKELNLTDNPESRPKNAAEIGDGFIDTSKSEFICPVVGLEMSGRYRFCFIWTCGCTVSERALREVKTEVCHKCGKAYKDDDVIILNGLDEEVTDLRLKMDERRALAKALKKSKKSGKHKLAKNGISEAGFSGEFKKPKIPDLTTSSSSSSSSTTTTKGRNDKIESLAGPSRSAVGKGATSKLLSKPAKVKSSDKTKVGSGPMDRDNNGQIYDKAKVGSGSMDIQTNRKTSETYKALFTSHENERLQTKPHWITMNPLYY